MRSRCGAVLVAAFVAGAVLAGCGGSDDQQVRVEATPEFLADSAERTSELETGRFETRIVQRFEGPADEEARSDVLVEGEFDASADLVAGTMTVESDGPGGAFGGKAETVQDGLDVYVRGFPYDQPPFSADADEWILIELPEAFVELSGAGGDTGAVASPAEQLELLRDDLDDVEDHGREEVRGVSTTHLSATYELSGPALEAFEQLAPGIDPPTRMPLDVWVDDEGLVRRIEQTNRVGEGVGSVRTSIVAEYFDLGIEVDIEVPDDATPLDDLLGEDLFGEDLLGDLDQQLQDAQDDLADAVAEAEALFDELPPDMRAIAEAMAELSPSQLAEDPCQVVEDPALRAQCEQYLPGFGSGG